MGPPSTCRFAAVGSSPQNPPQFAMTIRSLLVTCPPLSGYLADERCDTLRPLERERVRGVRLDLELRRGRHEPQERGRVVGGEDAVAVAPVDRQGAAQRGEALERGRLVE